MTTTRLWKIRTDDETYFVRLALDERPVRMPDGTVGVERVTPSMGQGDSFYEAKIEAPAAPAHGCGCGCPPDDGTVDCR
jgi:hypothetical protein